jgi:sigma-B regulation protein RsbU (phosphoserine phosphatase)
MYPVARINAAISTEREFIVYSALAALVILISLTLLFAHSFTVPLAHLQTAAEAVEKRDFDFKLPDLGHDEFGEMGRIFNKSIAELEELSLASIVQSRLMPAHTIASGRFDVFGRSVPMADLGGDYFDYFSIDDSRFAVLLGDVAGHGVGASLIMAMAKTAILCCKDFHDQPLQIINNLHRLICTTRSKKQRKIMTFQYLCFDKTTGLGKYANAGGCSPMLVCPDAASVSEITLSGPVLGGMKNSRFSEAELQMQPGQALVLYTDGIIESKNPAGDEIGFDRFKQWLIDHYHADATTYYNAVYEEYLRWLAGSDVQDDLTLIILVYQNKKP